jgi:thiamine-phosphate pyrophosphorylase
MRRVATLPRLFAAALTIASVGSAPFQCARKPGPDARLEDEPGQALYNLAQQFKADGNERARTETLQFLVKQYPSSRFAEQARLDLGAQLLVNDRLDLAAQLGADGVHLGRRSISVGDARRLVGTAFVTRACHDLDDVLAAANEGADGALYSPIFASPGKGAPLGLTALAGARASLDARGHRPFRLYALGGVDAENASRCFDAGADGIAVVRADLGPALAELLAQPARR